MVPVVVTTSAADRGAGTNVRVTCAASSNEPDDGCGSGDRAGDVQPTTQTTSFGAAQTMTFGLRAERCGTGAGRTYTITCTAMDPSGNVSAPVQAFIGVPHDESCHLHDDGSFVCH
jgi:hypothetical protein